MNNWSETQIGLIYYLGIAITIILAILVLVLTHKKLQDGLALLVGAEHALFWGQAIRLTIIAIAFVGALSVSFHGCKVDEYSHLLNSPTRTISRGLTQISRGSIFLARTILSWLLFLGLYFCLRSKRKSNLK